MSPGSDISPEKDSGHGCFARPWGATKARLGSIPSCGLGPETGSLTSASSRPLHVLDVGVCLFTLQNPDRKRHS